MPAQLELHCMNFQMGMEEPFPSVVKLLVRRTWSRKTTPIYAPKSNLNETHWGLYICTKHGEVEGGLVEEKEGIRGSRKGTRDSNRDREQDQ